ncbi:permease [Sphingomonas lenta]|uniref:Permease n=1 Tax=Sphingomonas lenta TaxID=1141887 RepID=A0A2A2SCI1_9SPHN|nr:permease [Sphingomonas lenta]
MLGPETRRRLTDRLGRLERETKQQMAVVTVATLGGEEVGAFTRRLGNQWGVGRKGVNDGIILLVAPRDQKSRISVGDGLRRELPDAFCQELMHHVLVPAFARGQLKQGVIAGVSVLIDRVDAAAALSAEIR